MAKQTEFPFQVKGYELDSFQHVNRSLIHIEMCIRDRVWALLAVMHPPYSVYINIKRQTNLSASETSVAGVLRREIRRKYFRFLPFRKLPGNERREHAAQGSHQESCQHRSFTDAFNPANQNKGAHNAPVSYTHLYWNLNSI